MTTLARRIVSEPVRTASETWKVIVDLLVPDISSTARRELLAVTGVASSLIAGEAIKDAPIIASGEGPQVRLYGLYAEDAILGEQANETPLVSSPVTGTWSMSLPCPADELEWVQIVLKRHSTRITARDMTSSVSDQNDRQLSKKTASIDTEAFFRP